MRSIAVLLAVGLILATCSPEPEGAAQTSACARKLFSSYNPKSFDQCTDVCIKCENGNMVTCSTSCTLKGAIRTK
jgi:hypothetical protein